MEGSTLNKLRHDDWIYLSGPITGIDNYMEKNLYYFVCKKLSRFNPESLYRYNDPKDDVRLIPVGFVNDNWKCDTTTDPEVFWAKP